MVESRVGLTSRLVGAMGLAERSPKVLISSSAVSYYEIRAAEQLNEHSAPHADFLAELCRHWEDAATDGTRIVCLRIGMVLGHGGGALRKMLPIFRWGLGGPLGKGRQFVPWIRLHDYIELIIAALEDHRREGPVKVVGPEPGSPREMTRVFSRSPRLALLALFGQAADLLLASHRVYPEKAMSPGFRFRFQTVSEALRDLLNKGDVDIGAIGSGSPSPIIESSYLKMHPPSRFLVTRTILNGPIDPVFSFFSKPTNLGVLTPSQMSFTVLSSDARMKHGATINDQVGAGGLRTRWRSRLECWEPKRRFVYSHDGGPWRGWWHQHHFLEDAGCIVMEDRVCSAAPLGLLGRLANGLFLSVQLRAICNYGAAAILFRFGADPTTAIDSRE